MLVLGALLVATAILAILIALGWVPDTREPGRHWYPAAPDPDEPRRTDHELTVVTSDPC